MTYTAASTSPGMNAAANRVPTDSPTISDNRMSTRLGGMICPSVPEAQMVPQEMLFL